MNPVPTIDIAETLEANQIARTFLSNGLSVIPVKGVGYGTGADDKRSLVRWTPFQHRRATEHDVDRWFKRWPSAGLAVVTGSISRNLVIVDVDPRSGGKQSIVSLHLPLTLVSATGGGGWHYFYFLRSSLPKKTAALPGVDLLCEGAYAVLPPTALSSGVQYRFVVAEKIANAPTWIEELLKNRPSKTNRPDVVFPGTRNDFLFRKGCGFVRNPGMTPVRLFKWLDGTNRRRCRPTLSEAEVKQISKNVWGTVKGK